MPYLKITYINVRLKLATLIMMIGLSALALAQENDVALMADMNNMKISKEEISAMIEMMESSGQITKADAEQAKKDLDSKTDQDIENLKGQAILQMQKGPEKGSENTARVPASDKINLPVGEKNALANSLDGKSSLASDRQKDIGKQETIDREKAKKESLKDALKYLNQ